MAKSPEPTAQRTGRLRQILQVIQMTVKFDPKAIWLLIAASVLPLVIVIAITLIFFRGDVLSWILMPLLGIMLALLGFTYTLNWRAERVAYSRLEGQKGGTGAALQGMLRGQWKTSDMPVAMNAKTQDVVFRAVGKPGVVLLTETRTASSHKLLVDEQRRVQRVVPNVPVHLVNVGHGDKEVPLAKLRRHLRSLPKRLTKEEIIAVSGRLDSLRGPALPIPKGIDPMRAAQHRPKIR